MSEGTITTSNDTICMHCISSILPQIIIAYLNVMKNRSQTKSQVRCHSLSTLTLLALVTLPIFRLRRFKVFFLHRKIQRYHIIPPIAITLLALLPSVKTPLLRLLRRHSIAKQYHIDLFEAHTAVE